MSIFKHIKRAFGLGDNFDSEDYDLDDYESYSPQPKRAEYHAPAIPSEKDESLSGDIFDGVIELFNRTQPEFVRECIDTDAQKNYILNNIDTGLKNRLEKEVASARARGKMLWEEELKKLDKEVETLKQEKETLEQKREESKSEKLSAERQKRALIERVHDLESQLLTLEAEKEQYVLENRSMLNKLRVASVTSGGASDEVVDEIERLGFELDAARKDRDAATLEAEHYKAVAHAHIPVMEYLLTTIEELVAEITSNSTNSTSQDEIEKLEAKLKDADENISSLNKRIEALTSSQDRDVREISDLSALVKEKDMTITELRKLLDERPVSLPSFDEPVTFSDSPSQDSEKDDSVKQSPKKSKQKPRISAIDELLESTDWFVAPTLPEEPEIPEKDKDDDFGYKAPTPRKAHPDDDKQLSLW